MRLIPCPVLPLVYGSYYIIPQETLYLKLTSEIIPFRGYACAASAAAPPTIWQQFFPQSPRLHGGNLASLVHYLHNEHIGLIGETCNLTITYRVRDNSNVAHVHDYYNEMIGATYGSRWH